MNVRYTNVKAALFFMVTAVCSATLPLCASHSENPSSQTSEKTPLPSQPTTKQAVSSNVAAEQRTRTIALYVNVIEEMSVRAMQVIRQRTGFYPTKQVSYLSHYLPKVKEALHKNVLPTWAHQNFVTLNDYTREILLRRGGLTRLNVRYLREAYGRVIAELDKCIAAHKKEPHLNQYISDEEKEALSDVRSALCGAYIFLKEDLFPYGGFVGWCKYLWETERVKACIGGTLTLAAVLTGAFLGVRAIRDKVESDNNKQMTFEKDYEPLKKSLSKASETFAYLKEKNKEMVPDEVSVAIRKACEKLQIEQQKNGWRNKELESAKEGLYKHPRLFYWLTYAQLKADGAHIGESLHVLSHEIAEAICPKNQKYSLGKAVSTGQPPEEQHYNMLRPLFDEMIQEVEKDKTQKKLADRTYKLVDDMYKEDALGDKYSEKDYRVLVCWANAHPTISLAYVYRKKIEDGLEQVGIEGLLTLHTQLAADLLIDQNPIFKDDPLTQNESIIEIFKKRLFEKHKEEYKKIKGQSGEQLSYSNDNYQKMVTTLSSNNNFKKYSDTLAWASKFLSFSFTLEHEKPNHYNEKSKQHERLKEELEKATKVLEKVLEKIAVIQTDNEDADIISKLQESARKKLGSTEKTKWGAVIGETFSPNQVTTTENLLMKLEAPKLLGAYICEIEEYESSTSWYRQPLLDGIKSSKPNTLKDLEELVKKEKESVTALIFQKCEEKMVFNAKRDGGDELSNLEVDNLNEEINKLELYRDFLADLNQRLSYEDWSFEKLKQANPELQEKGPLKEDRLVDRTLKKQYKETLKHVFKSIGVIDDESVPSYESSLCGLCLDLSNAVKDVNLDNETMLIQAQLIKGIHELADKGGNFDITKLSDTEDSVFESLSEKFIKDSLKSNLALAERKHLLVADMFLLKDILDTLEGEKVDWFNEKLENYAAARFLEKKGKAKKASELPLSVIETRGRVAIKACLEKLREDKDIWDEEHRGDFSQFVIYQRDRIKKTIVGVKTTSGETTIGGWKLIVSSRVSELVKWYVLESLLEVYDEVDWTDEKNIVAQFFEKEQEPLKVQLEALKTKPDALKAKQNELDTLKANQNKSRKFLEHQVKLFVDELRKEQPDDIKAYLYERTWELQQNAPLLNFAKVLYPKGQPMENVLETSSYFSVKASKLIELYIIEKLETADWLTTDTNFLLVKLDPTNTFNDAQRKCARTIICHLRYLERKKTGAVKERKAVLKKLEAVPSDGELFIKDELASCDKGFVESDLGGLLKETQLSNRMKMLETIVVCILQNINSKDWSATDDSLLKQLDENDTFGDSQKKCALSVIHYLKNKSDDDRNAIRKKPNNLALSDLGENLTRYNEQLIFDKINSVKDKLSKAKVFKGGVGKKAAFKDSFDVGSFCRYQWPTYSKNGYKICKKGRTSEITVDDLLEAYDELVPK